MLKDLLFAEINNGEKRHCDPATIQTWVFWALVRCSYQLSHWSSGIGVEDRSHFIHRHSLTHGLKLGWLCMVSTVVHCAAISKLGNSSSHSVCRNCFYGCILCSNASAAVTQLVRTSDRRSEGPGSNPGWHDTHTFWDSHSKIAIVIKYIVHNRCINYEHFVCDKCLIANIELYYCRRHLV